ncbi:MAG TPA: efflux transporter periplasmic adaptor subunit, partial [Acidovorax sp.]|nr:efflux transporter periplasmic adaptor subunit [Acidovorax sp.]
VVEGKEPGSKVTRRTPVQLGARSPGWVEVLDGLSAGDLVVTAGQQRIRKDGTEVRVVELGKQGNGGAAAAAARPLPGASGAVAGAAGHKAAPLADAPAPGASVVVAGNGSAPLPGTSPCQMAAASSRAMPTGDRPPV